MEQNIVDVKKLRELRGLTQKELAEFCGVSVRTIQNWESGASVPEVVCKYLTSQMSSSSNENIVCSSTTIGDNNTQIAGNANQVNTTSALEHALKEIAEQRKLVAKSQEQIDRLLSIIEKMTTN